MTRLGAGGAAPPRGLVPHGVESIPRHLVPPACDHDSHCITCGDEAVPLRVVRIDEVRELALCENDAGERTTVEIALVEPVSLNDVVLVHAGTAIARETA